MRMPLAMLSEEEEATVVEVKGGKGLVRRLSELGLTPGAKVKVLFSNSPGPVVIDVRGSKIALGRGLLMRIFVKPEAETH